MAKLTSKLIHDFLKKNYGISISDCSTTPVKNNEYKKKQKMYYSSEESQRHVLPTVTDNGITYYVTEPESTEKCEVVADVLEVNLITTEIASILKAKSINGQHIDLPRGFTLDWQRFLMEKDAEFANDIVAKANKENKFSLLTLDCLDKNSPNYKDNVKALEREIFEYNSAIVQAQKFLESKRSL